MMAGPGRALVCGEASVLHGQLARLGRLRPQLVISWGVCGGLDSRLRPGDLIVGSEIVSDGASIATDKFVASAIARRLTHLGSRVRVERLAGTNTPILTTHTKAKIHRATGAAAVDMESATAARIALALRSPFAIVRAIADPADRDLPPLVFKAVDADGRINGAAVVRALVRSPGQFAGLCAVARDSWSAMSALRRARRPLDAVFLDLGACPSDRALEGSIQDAVDASPDPEQS